MFITFEGPEGCGKSTQSKLFKEYLADKGMAVILTREPGGTRLGRELRSIVLDPKSALEETTEVFLFAADRSEHVDKIILPALRKNKTVICDRFIDSTVAYQIGGRKLPADLVRYVNMITSKGLIPDLTYLLDVTPEVGLKRAARKGKADRIEKEALAFHQQVRIKYLEIAKEEPGRVALIDSSHKKISEVQKLIRKVFNEKFGN